MKYILQGLDCPNCAAKIERQLRQIDGIGEVNINFISRSLYLDPRFEAVARQVISRVEPEVKLVPENSQKSFWEAAARKTKQQKSRQPFREKIEAVFGESAGSRNKLVLIIITVVLFISGLVFQNMLQETPYAVLIYAVFLTAYLLVGGKIVWTALRNVTRGKFFDENFLMTVATLGAIAINQIPEAVGVMLFFAVGEFFQDLAVNRSRRSITELMDVRPDYANLLVDGVSRRVSPGEVNVGQAIEVKPGEKVPLDGEVLEGSSFVDTSALTGEPVPRKVEPGDTVLSGVINGSGLLKIKVRKRFGESSVAKILALVENAAARKAPTEQFITKFARYYTPVVVFGALAVAVIPPLVLPGVAFSAWIYRALVLLVISCPCALVVSIPLSYFGGVGAASRAGVLVKGANFLEALTRVGAVAFDKTGTLTKGVFRVTGVVAKNGFLEEEVLRLAALAEAHSSHPIAVSVREAYKTYILRRKEEAFLNEESTFFNDVASSNIIEEYQEIKGYGVKVNVQGKTVLAGNDRLLHREGIEHDDCNVEGTVVYVAVDGVFAGYLVIADEVREGVAAALNRLKRLGVKKTVMLTGDDRMAAARAAEEVGVDDYFAELLPQDKVTRLEKLKDFLFNANGKGEKLVFVGDGINDAPVIMRADVGVAMGGLGSDAAIEAADVVIMDDDPGKLVRAIEIARRTKNIVLQNIVMALGIKGIFIVSGILGTATMWEAVFADVGVTLVAVLNAARILR